MKLWIMIFFLSLNATAQILSKEACGDTDIRETNPVIKNSPKLVKHFSTPKDQDSIGWCYGFTAADLLSAEIGEPVSAFHVSALFNKKMRQNIFSRMGFGIKRLISKPEFTEVYEGGFARFSIDLARKNGGICREETLPFNADQRATHDLITELEFLKKHLKLLKNDALLCAIVDNRLKAFDLSVDASLLAESLINENMNISLEKIAREQCKNNLLKVPNFKTKKIFGSGKKFLKDFNAVLDRGRPIEVSYNVKPFIDEDGVHSSLVTARRWYAGKCQYKIRNSWGKTCAFYNKKVICEKESGSYWVNDEDFAKAHISSTYIVGK